MKFVELFPKEYRKRSDLFLLPLTGLPKGGKITSYMFWDIYSIENFQLILKINEEKNLVNEKIIPILDKNAPIIECYEDDSGLYFVVDLSEWALDIELVLAGKYSKMSKSAKKVCENFHSYNNTKGIIISIYGIMYPDVNLELLGGKSALQYYIENYVGEEYARDVMKIGEIGSIYDKMAETLNLNIERNKICEI